MAYLTYKDFEVEDGFIYVIKVRGYCKIGKSANFEKRFGEYTMLFEEPEIVLLDYVSDYHRMELDLHKAFDHKRARGEWFRLSERDIEHIKFMLSAYHVKNEKDQMDDLIRYASELLHKNFKWEKRDDGEYYIYEIVGKNGKTKIPYFFIQECKTVKEVQIKVLYELSFKEQWYQDTIDSIVLKELVEEDNLSNIEQQSEQAS